jgi:hypothetical protein
VGKTCLGFDSILAQVEGSLNLTSSEGGHQSTKLINDCHALWNRKDKNASPDLISFSCVLPHSYEHDGLQHSLPPSYSSSHTGAYTVLVSSHYAIKIHVKRTLHHALGKFLTTTKQYEYITLSSLHRLIAVQICRIEIPFRYRPRTRPHRPILASSDFFSTVKAFPGEWFQALSEIKSRPTSQLDPISCHVRISPSWSG